MNAPQTPHLSPGFRSGRGPLWTCPGVGFGMGSASPEEDRFRSPISGEGGTWLITWVRVALSEWSTRRASRPPLSPLKKGGLDHGGTWHPLVSCRTRAWRDTMAPGPRFTAPPHGWEGAPSCLIVVFCPSSTRRLAASTRFLAGADGSLAHLLASCRSFARLLPPHGLLDRFLTLPVAPRASARFLSLQMRLAGLLVPRPPLAGFLATCRRFLTASRVSCPIRLRGCPAPSRPMLSSIRGARAPHPRRACAASTPRLPRACAACARRLFVASAAQVRHSIIGSAHASLTRMSTRLEPSLVYVERHRATTGDHGRRARERRSTSLPVARRRRPYTAVAHRRPPSLNVCLRGSKPSRDPTGPVMLSTWPTTNAALSSRAWSTLTTRGQRAWSTFPAPWSKLTTNARTAWSKLTIRLRSKLG